MIPITVMVAGIGTVSHKIKGVFGPGRPSRFAEVLRPVVVWNLTYACNLRCPHCYIDAGPPHEGELGTEEALDLVDQLSEIRSPLVIFSGGEPLIRKDFLEVAKYAASKGLKLALSTNGTLITRELARALAELGFAYVGVSIDSPIPEWHDKFRGVSGAFDAAMRGIRNSMEAGLLTGIRYTVMRYNVDEVPLIIKLALNLGIPRVTFYHLSSAGRARAISPDWYITPIQYFNFIDYLIEVSKRYAGRLEVETTMAPFDGIYVADRVARSGEEFRSLMEVVSAQGGCGRKIISIYPDGTARPCQFVDFIELGNVRERGLRDILTPDHPGIEYFTETHKYLKGPKCSECPFKEVCNGGDRIRAYYLGGGLHGDDPQCFLEVDQICERWGFGLRRY